MSQTQIITGTPEGRALIERFRSNPVGLEVELRDGRTFQVAGFVDSPRMRWLRLRRLGTGQYGPTVPEHDVAFVTEWTIGLADGAKA